MPDASPPLWTRHDLAREAARVRSEVATLSPRRTLLARAPTLADAVALDRALPPDVRRRVVVWVRQAAVGGAGC